MKKSLLVASLSLVLVGAGCLGGSSTPAGGGGVYGSVNGGKTWTSMSALPLATGVSTISGADILALEKDPSNSNVIYAGTLANGLLTSFDAGKSWQRPAEDKAFDLVRTGAVLDVEVNPKAPCTFYVLKTDRLLKTDTCGRTYNTEAYKEGRATEKLTAMALDWFNPQSVWLGTTAGDVFHSTDGGATWATADRLKDDVSAIEISNSDSRVVLVGTLRRGMVRSIDAGATWTDFDKDFTPYKKSAYVHGFAQTNDGKTLVMSSDFGLLQSVDAGATWKPITLVTASGEVKIKAVGVAPKNGKVIVYGTDSTIYRSVNGGVAWTTSGLPSTRPASVILFSTDDENTLLLGVQAPPKK